jgi:hypothetical protein
LKFAVAAAGREACTYRSFYFTYACMPEVLCRCTPMSACVPKLVLAARMMGSSIMVVWEACRRAAAATCCCGGRRCGGGSNSSLSRISIRSSSSLLRSKALRIFALFIGWGLAVLVGILLHRSNLSAKREAFGLKCDNRKEVS